MIRHLGVLFVLILFAINYNAYSQSKSKKNVHIYFKEDKTIGIYKEQRGTRTGKNYDIYWYLQKGLDRKTLRFAYVPVNNKIFVYKNARFVKDHVKTIDKLKDIPAFGFDTSDKKRFPFKNVYIVEYISPNKFKVIRVNSYIGSDYN